MQLGKFPRLLPKEFKAKLAYACVVFGRKCKVGGLGFNLFSENCLWQQCCAEALKALLSGSAAQSSGLDSCSLV